MAAGNTYTPIATTTFASASSAYTFSSIPGTYTDLILISAAKNAVADNAIYLTFNSDTATNYSNTILYGSGTAAGSGRGSNQTYCIVGRTNTSEFCPGITHIQNYSNATTYKTVLSRGGNAGNYVLAYVNLWRSTSAITSMTCTSGSGNFEIGSTLSLYGILAA